ncbi:MAG: DoxX family protein [Bacteroidota bacterium]
MTDQAIPTSPAPKRTALNITLWVLQALFAASFLMAGSQKAFGEVSALLTTMPWVATMPLQLVRFIGISELLGAAGLILPAALKIRPALTTLAAAGLAVIMLLANIFHISRGEFMALPFTLVMFVLVAFIAYGRWKLVPIAGK